MGKGGRIVIALAIGSVGGYVIANRLTAQDEDKCEPLPPAEDPIAACKLARSTARDRAGWRAAALGGAALAALVALAG